MDYLITIRLPDSISKKLKERSKETGYSINSVIREAVITFLDVLS